MVVVTKQYNNRMRYVADVKKITRYGLWFCITMMNKMHTMEICEYGEMKKEFHVHLWPWPITSCCVLAVGSILCRFLLNEAALATSSAPF